MTDTEERLLRLLTERAAEVHGTLTGPTIRALAGQRRRDRRRTVGLPVLAAAAVLGLVLLPFLLLRESAPPAGPTRPGNPASVGVSATPPTPRSSPVMPPTTAGSPPGSSPSSSPTGVEPGTTAPTTSSPTPSVSGSATPSGPGSSPVATSSVGGPTPSGSTP